MKMQRSAGILLPISSLPSPYGIGCFSQEAYDFVDWLKGKQRYCGAGCRDFMTPGPTVEQVAEKANRNIRKLASLAAGKDKAYRKRLIEKYTVGPS